MFLEVPILVCRFIDRFVIFVGELRHILEKIKIYRMACEFVAQPKTFSSIHFYQYTLLTDE